MRRRSYSIGTGRPSAYPFGGARRYYSGGGTRGGQPSPKPGRGGGQLYITPPQLDLRPRPPGPTRSVRAGDARHRRRSAARKALRPYRPRAGAQKPPHQLRTRHRQTPALLRPRHRRPQPRNPALGRKAGAARSRRPPERGPPEPGLRPPAENHRPALPQPRPKPGRAANASGVLDRGTLAAGAAARGRNQKLAEEPVDIARQRTGEDLARRSATRHARASSAKTAPGNCTAWPKKPSAAKAKSAKT